MTLDSSRPRRESRLEPDARSHVGAIGIMQVMPETAAGHPNRIARLRKLAPEYGVDPNVWFKNVERIVASKVSREPIRYVGNIYKYYLAYRRLREIEKERASQSAG